MAKMPEKRRSEKKELKVISTNARQDQISFKRSFLTKKYIFGKQNGITISSKICGKKLNDQQKALLHVFCIAVHFYTLP